MDDDGAEAMVEEGEEWNLELRGRKGERRGLEIRFRVWVKLKFFNANNDEDIANAFIFLCFG